MSILLLDGVRYYPYNYKNENELEDMIIEHYKELFSNNSILFEKRKIKTLSGLGAIPDGFIMNLDDEEWYIIEVELASHDLYNHIVPQITKFNRSYENPKTINNLRDAFYNDIKNNPNKKIIFENKGITELHKFITDIIENPPKVIILIDQITQDLKDVSRSLPFNTIKREFKTYERENIGISVHIHLFDPIIRQKKFKKTESKKIDIFTEEEDIVIPEKNVVKMKLEKDIFIIQKKKDILFYTAKWLVDKGKLTKDLIPISSGSKRYIVNTKPVHKSGKSFWAPKKLQNDIYLETHAGEGPLIKQSKILLEACGYSPSTLKLIGID